MSGHSLGAIELRREKDVVLARQRGRRIAELLGFPGQEQTRIATAISEIARNACQYAGGGTVRFQLDEGPPARLVIRIEDRGPGIPNLPDVLDGYYRSTTGMGLGIVGARRLVDAFRIETQPDRGTTVEMAKDVPRNGSGSLRERLPGLVRELATTASETAEEEVLRQNRELLRLLEETERINRELEETNRGVVALYAELDEHALQLRRASDMKSQFLSNMSHEFRTPLNAIRSLSGLLLEGAAGPLTPEQERPVALIRKSVDELSELVDDLLDLAKVEAGKIVVRPTEFYVGDLFAALRAILRPLLANTGSVALTFEEPPELPPLYTDEAKVAQILRNFVSNALKFTERGEVRVSVAAGPGDTAVFSVADTGIGIAPEDQERIFEEFVQVEGPHQKRARGTGLGLPLSRKLAGLLGGRVLLDSRPGAGSTFSLAIPRVYQEPSEGEETRHG